MKYSRFKIFTVMHNSYMVAVIGNEILKSQVPLSDAHNIGIECGVIKYNTLK